MGLLVTGGYGFIGSNFIRFMLENTDYEVVNLDALTYSGNRDNLKQYEDSDRYSSIQGRIEDRKTVKKAFEDVDYVVNFAAETHVDRSISEPSPFIITNVMGTQVLLEASREYNVKRFLHVSTDEIYGSLESIEENKFTEEHPFKPNSPYSASKASADLLVRAYYKTYGLPALTVRPSNNYGPYQFPEKFIPLMITNLMENKTVPVYSRGENIRDWLFVEDCVRGVYEVLQEGRPGQPYNLGGGNEKRNIYLARAVVEMMGKDESHLEFVKDRPGHDYRYALDITKVKDEVGWEPSLNFEEGLRRTVEWYEQNGWWWKPLKERLEKESKGYWS